MPTSPRMRTVVATQGVTINNAFKTHSRKSLVTHYPLGVYSEVVTEYLPACILSRSQRSTFLFFFVLGVLNTPLVFLQVCTVTHTVWWLLNVYCVYCRLCDSIALNTP